MSIYFKLLLNSTFRCLISVKAIKRHCKKKLQKLNCFDILIC